MSSSDNLDDEFKPTQTEGYKVGQQKTVEELAALDKEDESLQRWKASLGISTNAAAQAGPKKIVPKTLFLESPDLAKPVVLDLTQSPEDLAKLKSNPITIKEGVEYSVGITFVVEGQLVSGLKYLQLVKKMSMTVDKMEAMIGSYAPNPQPYSKVFAAEQAPSGMLARGNYVVRSRIVDDDDHVWLYVEWGFKIAKDW